MQTKITINLPDEDEALASTAVVRQSHTLLYRSLAVHEPTVVFVRRGRKKLRWAGRELVVEAGGAAALADWSAAMLAGRLHCSEATLRRRLAKQGTGFRTLLTDVRMTRALTLLQVTPWPVEQIAGAVGYESPSRFAARFKERFGFAPSAVRAESEEEAAYRLAGPVSVGIRP